MSLAAAGGHLKKMKFLNAKFALKWNFKPFTEAVVYGYVEIVKWVHFELDCLLSSDFDIKAARGGNIGLQEMLDGHSISLLCWKRNSNPEVAEWYKNDYGNPRKRKYEEKSGSVICVSL
ncbi:hypothetical protein PHMEG_00017456 [Phytophthora megakarya]|uniref:Uncharacterized protein n=1 Tax=Phytophthora megakarya TaxID=4795 RepID=A0A225VWG2_9STRA|nr:hypothetical protein PHMEG_00017456 [Phytophthora megakarya]